MIRFIQSSGTAFFAGSLSLISQIIGLRMVTRELSASEWTIASILVSALAGLSLGALLSGRIADQKSSPMRMALSLLAIASVAVLLFALGGRGFASQIRGLNFSETLEAFCFSAVTILPINVLLGGIVPVLTRSTVSSSGTDVQTAFGWIYAWETLGAAIGSLVITFVAVPALGVHTSLLLTASIVLAWSAINWFIPALEQPNREDKPTKTVQEFSGEEEAQPNARGALRSLLLIAALASSCASLGMELVWQRYFAVVFGSDSHSYAIVAMMFLAGNSIGSLFAARLFRFQNASKAFYRWQLLLIGGAILFSIWALRFGFQLETLRWALSWLEENPLPGRLLMAAGILLLPAILIGSALPVLVKLWTTGQSSVGARAGEIYACVIIGNVIGVLVCASFLIPVFGLRVTAVILSAICIAVSAGLFFLASPTTSDSKPRTAVGTGRSASYWILLTGVLGLGLHIINSPFRPGLSDDDSQWVLDHYVEQASHTVAVIHSKEHPHNKRLLIDGVTIGESGGGVDEKQQVLAHLPFLIGNTTRSNVLTIGLGTGILAGKLAENEQVQSLTCVELSPEIIKASEWFDAENRGVLGNSKLNLVRGDGVRFLRNSDEPFDVIVSDGKSRPGAASNLPFFSEEYYEICADSLSEQGVFVQWVSLRCDANELKTILATFSGKFPFGHVAIAAPDSVYLVGTRSAVDFDSQRIEEYFGQQSTERLKSYSWKTTDDVLSMYWLDQQVIQTAFADINTNTFDRPVLENFAWASFGHSLSQQPTQISILQDLIKADASSFFNGKPLVESTPSSADSIGRGRKGAIELIQGEAIRIAAEEEWLDRAAVHFKSAVKLLPSLSRQSHLVDDYRALADLGRVDQDRSKEFSSLLNISELRGTTAGEEYRMAQILEAEQAVDQSLKHYYRAVEISGRHPKYLSAFGEVLLSQGRDANALKQFEGAIAGLPIPDGSEQVGPELEPRTRLLKGIAMQRLGRDEAGNEIINAVLKTHPQFLDVYRRYGFN